MEEFLRQKLQGLFGGDTRLSNVRYVDLETYRNYIKGKPTKNKTVRTVASINKEISCLHHIFTKAVEWEMIERNPFDKGKTLLAKENNKRFRYLTQDEVNRLIDKCTNTHTREIVVTALNTGMRRQEILSLRWDQIKDGFFYLSKTKTDEARQVPINDDLAGLFRYIRSRNQLKFEYVFCDKKGKPYKEVKNSFNAALRRAKIEDFRFHDLRHTFASHFVMRGGTLKELQEILGHKTMAMTMRYAHLSQEHKKKAVNLLNGLTAPQKPAENTCHKTVTSLNSAVSSPS